MGKRVLLISKHIYSDINASAASDIGEQTRLIKSVCEHMDGVEVLTHYVKPRIVNKEHPERWVEGWECVSPEYYCKQYSLDIIIRKQGKKTTWKTITDAISKVIESPRFDFAEEDLVLGNSRIIKTHIINGVVFHERKCKEEE